MKVPSPLSACVSAPSSDACAHVAKESASSDSGAAVMTIRVPASVCARRGARNLFSPARLKFIALPAGYSSPFANVSFEPRQAMRYRSSFDIKKLIKDAQTGLSESDPESFKVFLLACMVGLRRAEIDRLEWTAFDWQLEKLHIGVTEHFAVTRISAQRCRDNRPSLFGQAFGRNNYVKLLLRPNRRLTSINARIKPPILVSAWYWQGD